MVEGLWGDDFEVVDNTKLILDNVMNPKNVNSSVDKLLKSKKLSLEDRLTIIKSEVLRVLGKYQNDTLVIKDITTLHNYITKSIENGILAIDTETNNSLDPITCKLMGLCIYTSDMQRAYVPVNHRDSVTQERFSWQVTEEDIRNELQRVVDAKTYIVMHNGKFDYQVIKCTCNIAIPVDWDTMIAARMIDENEKSAGLKYQYSSKIDPTQEEYDIEKLFSGVEYADVEPEVFALYSATDAYDTYKLYKFQYDILTQPNMSGVYKLFMNVEMQDVIPVAEMELWGIAIDQDLAKKLDIKYNKLLSEVDSKVEKELEQYKSQIASWKRSADGMKLVGKKHKYEQLTDPINLESPTQLAIILYDIIGVEPVSDEKPRGTGEDELTAIAEQNDIPLCKLILERRHTLTLLNDFIQKLPALANEKTGRIHCHFNQCGKEDRGVVTGRFSSSDPNLQQIPSHNKEIRMMFSARDGYVIIGSDYSAQEPRLTAHYSGDENMLKAYKAGQDLYSVIASISFGYKYEECLEFYPAGTEIVYEGKKVICGNKTHQNKEGKERRSQAKAILLGLLYGRGAKSIGEQIGKSAKEGQEVIDNFFKSFPKVKDWIDSTHRKVRENGWVEDWYGRRRRLPDINLPPYSAKYISEKGKEDLINFNPIIGCEDRVATNDKLIQKYLDKCNKIRFNKEFYKIKEEALKDGIQLESNTNLIARAERQSVNSIVQGGAATLTKMAMRDIYNDKELNELGFHLMVTVHDEVLGECPEENADKVAERLTKVMIDAAKPYMEVPMSCDAYVVKHWYEDEYAVAINKEYSKYIKTMDDISAFNKICEEHTEMSSEELHKILYK